ncbi:hypothetical protein EW146_g4299 [Bondarzewia mesenterica]|uniref:Uncharacterized protein n=1 Tax=Bondarzewia mesenterica TaxID=1095465 RepID=A0A4S4LV09_9AGAM|nr:hypothetical protein EW146_g4299 [Bondarzewia mesenterica]
MQMELALQIDLTPIIARVGSCGWEWPVGSEVRSACGRIGVPLDPDGHSSATLLSILSRLLPFAPCLHTYSRSCGLQDHVGEVHEAVRQLIDLQKTKRAAAGVEDAGGDEATGVVGDEAHTADGGLYADVT